MTTQHDHTPYLDQLTDDPQSFWESRIKASRWMIIKTTCLGVLAVEYEKFWRDIVDKAEGGTVEDKRDIVATV